MSKLIGVFLNIIENDRIPALIKSAEAIKVAYVDALRQLDVPGVGDTPVCAEAFVKKTYKDISKKTKVFFKAARSLYTECSTVANKIMDGSPSLLVFDLHTDRLDNMISEIVKIISQTCEPGFEVPETTRAACDELILRFKKLSKELEMIGMVWQRDEEYLRTPDDALRRKSRKKAAKAAKKGGRRKRNERGTKKLLRIRRKKNS
jgi:hypothetical protein